MKLFGLPAAAVFFWWTAASLATTVSSFSTGAGGCAGGMAAVGSGHLRDGATTGSLADGGITISVDGGGTALEEGATLDATVMEEVVVTATATNEPFKGILIRLESGSTDMTGVLSAGSALLQDAAACAAPVAGVTHTSSDEKTQVEVSMTPEAEGTVQMDVTVVLRNNADGSTYYYGQYTVNVAAASAGGGGGNEEVGGGDETSPTDAPVEPPAPGGEGETSPTDAPVEPPAPSGAVSRWVLGVSSLALAVASFVVLM
jgi:Reeler domain